MTSAEPSTMPSEPDRDAAETAASSVDRAALASAPVDPARRRRRPTGAPPPLPRGIGSSGVGWLVFAAALVVGNLVAKDASGVQRTMEDVDAAILRALAGMRADWLTPLARRIDRFGSGWNLTILGIGLVLALIAFKRWRHLFAFIGGVVVVELVGSYLHGVLDRPRPFDVTIIGRWGGFSALAPPVAVLTAVLVAVIYSMVVPGRSRTVAKLVVAVVVGVFAWSRLYLAVDHPSDTLTGVALAVGIVISAFRFSTPNDVFPVRYKRGKTAHLDVDGARGEAIRIAMCEQLGLDVLGVEHVGLEGSGGSTPLRITVCSDPPTYLFGKLYAMSHVRADRWYKWGRTILYGRLEDEAPFQSVRRLVEYEDYALRLMRDLGLPTAAPAGIVEITPEREYLFLTEFVEGGEVGDADVEVTDEVIEDGLALIRQLWDAGLAHRDIKPANLLVRDGHMVVIDVFFMQVRPSPWRQAVDLANMMLVLALRSDADRVYERALVHFSPDEIAEAFAATRGVASPTQLRTMLKQDGRDLVTQFRELAPPRRPIGLQRWSVTRFVLAAALVAIAWLMVSNAPGIFAPTHDIPVAGTPLCQTDNLTILMSQAVPSATSVPCIAGLPAGWELGGTSVRDGEVRFWLDLGSADRTVEAALVSRDECDVVGATEVPSDEDGMQRFERPERLPPGFRATRYYLFEGGCITYDFAFRNQPTAATLFAAELALGFQSRAPLVEDVRERTGLRLCGADAPPCTGSSD